MVLSFFSGRLPSLTVNKSLVVVPLPRIAGWTKLCNWVNLSHIFTVPHCAPHFVAELLGVLVHFVPGRSSGVAGSEILKLIEIDILN